MRPFQRRDAVPSTTSPEFELLAPLVTDSDSDIDDMDSEPDTDTNLVPDINLVTESNLIPGTNPVTGANPVTETNSVTETNMVTGTNLVTRIRGRFKRGASFGAVPPSSSNTNCKRARVGEAEGGDSVDNESSGPEYGRGARQASIPLSTSNFNGRRVCSLEDASIVDAPFGAFQERRRARQEAAAASGQNQVPLSIALGRNLPNTSSTASDTTNLVGSIPAQETGFSQRIHMAITHQAGLWTLASQQQPGANLEALLSSQALTVPMLNQVLHNQATTQAHVASLYRMIENIHSSILAQQTANAVTMQRPPWPHMAAEVYAQAAAMREQANQVHQLTIAVATVGAAVNSDNSNNPGDDQGQSGHDQNSSTE
jgi:hypothetical protein